MKKTIGLTITIFALVLLLSGCGTRYKVTFDSNGGSNVRTQRIAEDGTITLPEAPTKEGYLFSTWYENLEMTRVYDIDLVVTEDITLYAKWNPVVRGVYLMNGDTALAGFYIDYNEVIELPNTTITGYNLLGWYSDSEFENEVTSVTGTLEDIVVYGKFEETDYDVPVEGTIDLTELPYYSYLDENNPVVTITVKDIGAITLELFPDVAGNSVNNFIAYIQAGSYANSTFHRVIEDFMIQGGMVENELCSISGEFTSNGFTNDLSHFRGVLSMARTSDVNSGSSQFFIAHVDYPSLDDNYATFGGMTSGFNVLDYIAGVSTDGVDAPIREVLIESITIELNGYVPSAPVCAN